MVSATERRTVYILCLAVFGLGLFALSRTVDSRDFKTIGVSLGLIAIAIVTAVAAGRSGRTDGGLDRTILEGGPE